MLTRYLLKYLKLLLALVADEVLFNSEYNLSSFLDNISRHFKTQPDYRPDDKLLAERIRSKAAVLYFPIYEELKLVEPVGAARTGCLHIVWPHRWEHDKNPEAFFQALYRLRSDGASFQVSVLGETYSEVPPIFDEARTILSEHIVQFGFAETRERYYEILGTGDVVVSTAVHEFFGVSMLEATYLGCYPLVPNRLVYPELYPSQCIYNTDTQLYNKLKKFAANPTLVRDEKVEIDFTNFSFDKFSRVFNKVL